jgi:Fic family protein
MLLTTTPNEIEESGRPAGRGMLVPRIWQAQLAGIGGRRARGGFPYEAYVPEAIGDREFTLTNLVATAATNAEAAVRELNENPSQSNLEALARQLLRSEAVASSRIEGLVLSHRRLAQAAFAPGNDVTAQSVLANIDALERAVTFAAGKEELSIDDIIDIHRVLFTGTRDEHLAGVLRERQNWIGGEATSPRTAEFIPPPPEYVRALLADLCDFLNRDDVPAVIQAAIAHVQFETIHPFADGNGRVGRTLVLAVLRRRGIAERYLPPVSLALAGRADQYVMGLTNWRYTLDGADWLLFFADAVWRAATGAEEFAKSISELQQQWIADAGTPRKGSSPLRLIELLPSNPVVNVKTVSQWLEITSEAARQAILRLEKAGVLRQVTIGRRHRVWETVGLFNLLDEFERDLGPASRTPRPTR